MDKWLTEQQKNERTNEGVNACMVGEMDECMMDSWTNDKMNKKYLVSE